MTSSPTVYEVRSFEAKEAKEQKKLVLEKQCPKSVLKGWGVPEGLSGYVQLEWLEENKVGPFAE
ncbi:hypothetical protein ACEPPN_011121 [Leptodophora sp. 'Broadleaf-Isolate-01']